MGYSKEVYAEATRTLHERRTAAEQIAAAHRNEVLRVCPQLREIEGEMAKTGLAAVKAVGGGENAVDIIRNLAKYNLDLQESRAALLTANGFPADYLRPPYTCACCADTGTQNGAECACVQKLLKEIAYKQLARVAPLAQCSFESFSLECYPTTPNEKGVIPRVEMTKILAFCKAYANSFSLQSDSLFFFGRTGLGKTHLSLAIAAAALEKGFDTVYFSAQNLFSKLTKEHFGRSEEDTETLVLQCDFLILDDLGTEYPSAFVTAALYNIVNTRLLAGKPTLINSNLDPMQLQKVYTERFISRLAGCYSMHEFCGTDIRVEKQIRKNQQNRL